MSGSQSAVGASVIVVGGGVTGLSAAWWLARSGVDVIVIEKNIVGWGASGRNGGGATHYHSPLFAEEQRLWPQMDDLLGYPTEYRSKRIRVAINERQMEAARPSVDRTLQQGFPARWLDAKEVRDLVPLAGESAVGGVFFDRAGQANPQRTVQAYAWALQDLGGKLLQHTEVVGFERVADKVTTVKTTNGNFACDQLLIAAGPQTGSLSRLLGREVPVTSARAEMIVTEPVPLMPIGGVDGNGLFGRQTLRGNLVYGGGPHEWLPEGSIDAERPSSPLSRSIAKRLVEMFPKAQHIRVIRSWGGIIENTPDGRPVIDHLPGASNVVVATMSSVGFGLSPASGHAICEMLLEGKCQFANLSDFQLSRFDNLSPGWREEWGWVPPQTLGAVGRAL
ncbi:NAD(P)/FAD-dependent oxidoreductase [Mesorhizobium sp. ORS 3428]|uniref:NAD(P)/FAD-dependent oxidoreductase n=2 Tax=Mesorhizobium sp. ORS 3428 TaxID=540997 RepID=UPI0009F4727B|nr:FAD-binding oxidoreductase [Mesorhizobium sp. ORS 3428]